MRVIRTELLYKGSDLTVLTDDTERGVSVAWSTIHEPVEVDDEFLSELIDVGAIEDFTQIENVRQFLDGTIEGGVYRNLYRSQGSGIIAPLYYPDAIEQVLQAAIVIEHSPPTTEMLSALLSKATPLAGGLFLGIQLAEGNTIMLVTVPLGILLVGTAVAVTKAIEVGLMRAVTGRGKPAPRRRKRRRAVDDDRGSGASFSA